MPPQQRAEHGGSRSRSARRPATRRYADSDHTGSAQNFLIEPPRLWPERNQDGGPWTDAWATSPRLEGLLGSLRETGDRLQTLQRQSLDTSARSLDLVTHARPAERRGGHTGEILALQADLARQQAEMAAIIARVSGILEALVADGVGDLVAAQRARGSKSQSEGTDRVLTGLLVMILFLTLVLAALVYVLATGGVLRLPFATS